MGKRSKQSKPCVYLLLCCATERVHQAILIARNNFYGPPTHCELCVSYRAEAPCLSSFMLEEIICEIILLRGFEHTHKKKYNLKCYLKRHLC